MTTQLSTKDRTRLHQWIDNLPPRQFSLMYHLVEEFIQTEQAVIEYLLSSNKMRERLLAARESGEGNPVEVVREELGI